jgi:hypothetical protein
MRTMYLHRRVERWSFFIVAGATFCLFPAFVSVYAARDTTPPVLLDLVAVPQVFDARLADVDVTICVTAFDEFSGLNNVNIQLIANTNLGNRSASFGILDTACLIFTIPHLTPPGTIHIRAYLDDNVRNRSFYSAYRNGGALYDLCAVVAQCTLHNRMTSSLPDTDADGVPDDADNCVKISNPMQQDQDFDSLGDACDPFPADRDNVAAQCAVDFMQCTADLAQCKIDAGDDDGDGELNVTDRCTNTLSGETVDDGGCSHVQFCNTFDVSDFNGRRNCDRSDWKNDEPATSFPQDCTNDRVNNTCIPL